MCFYKSVKYTCAHAFFTIRIRTCHVEDEYRMDRGGCGPCNVKTSHALRTIAIDRRCDACLHMDARVVDMKAVLEGARAKIDEMSAIRDLAKGLLEKNYKVVLERGVSMGAYAGAATSVTGKDKRGPEGEDGRLGRGGGGMDSE